MAQNNPSNPNIRPADQFGAYKVGEFAQGQGNYKVQPVTGGPARSEAQNMLKGIQDSAGGEMDFKKRHKLQESTGEDQFQKEYKSSRDALAEFSPLKWRQQWQLIRNFTPEEIVTLDLSKIPFVPFQRKLS